MRVGTPRRREEAGATFVEVLLAVVILTVGLLGLLGSQGAALWQHRTAEAQMTATHLAETFAEQARANLPGVRAGIYAWERIYQSGEDAAGPSCDPVSPCAPEQIALNQLASWLTTVRSSLPAGDAYVRTTPDREYLEIWVMWKRGDSSTAEVSTDEVCATEAISHLAPQLRPACAYFRVKV